MLNTGGGIFNQQTPGGGLFNTATNQLGTGGGNQLGGGIFNTSAGRTGGLGGGLFNTQTPQNQQQPGRMFNMGAQTTGGIGGGLGQGGGLFQSPLGGGTGLGAGTGLTLGANQGLGGGLFSTPLGGATGNTGLFNQQQQQQQQGLGGGLFSQQTTGGLFSGATGLGLGGTTVNGTTIKFDPPTGTDTVVRNGTNQNTTTKLQCICAMKQYENYSMEELRWADYQAGRNKGSTGGLGLGIGGAKIGGGLFSQNQQSTSTAGTGLFSQNKPIGGGLNTGLGGGLFNQQQGLGGGLFNQQQQQAANTAGGLFSQSGTTGGLGGGLGGGLFNQQQQQGITGGLTLFNSATVANTGGLGATGIGGLFNTQNTVGTGLGQQAAGGGLFNTSKPNALGGGLNLGGGLGGLNSNLGGGLNKTGGLQFGTGIGLGTGIGGLGKTDALKGIGQQPTSLGLGLGIGQSNQPKIGLGAGLSGGLGGGLGAGTALGGGLGSNLGAGVKIGTGGLGGGSGLGSTLGGTASQFSDVATLQQQAQLQQQLQVLATSPFGDSPLFRTSLKEAASAPNPPAKADPPTTGGKHDFVTSSHYKMNIRHGRTKMAFKPQSLSSPSHHVDKSLMFEGLDDLESGTTGTFKPRKNFKKLVIPPHSPRPTPGVADTTTTTTTTTTAVGNPITEVTPPATISTKTIEKTTPKSATVLITTSPSTMATPPSAGNKLLTTPPSSLSSVESPALVVGSLYSNSVMKPIARRPTPPQLDNTMLAFSKPHPHTPSTEQEQPSSSSPTPIAGPSGVINTRSDYYTIPPVDELDSMATADSSDPILVENFTVGRRDYGVIFFSGKTDVRDLNLDELVYIGHKEVAVYQDDSCKPPQGEGLNKKATITLENTWPLDKTTRQQIKDPARLLEMKYAEKVESSTTKIGARFIDYRPETGSWIFEVDHFSKYKLQENTSDDEGDQQQQQKQPMQQLPLKTANVTTAKLPPPKPASSTIPESNKGESEEEAMSDDNSEQHLRESPTHEMDAAPIPHSYNLAASMGVSSHKVQVMKASFFTDPSTSIHPSNQYSSTLMSQQHPRGLLLNGSTPPLLFKQPAVLKPQQQQLQPQQEESPFSLLSPLSIPDLSSPPVTSAGVPQGLMPFALLPELVTDCFRTCVRSRDLGLAFGRSFRTGWAPHWNFVHFGIAVSSKPYHKKPSGGLLRPLGLQKHLYSASGPKDIVPFKITLEQLRSSPYLTPEGLRGKALSAMFEPLLAVQLQHSEVGGAGIPHIVPVKGNAALASYTTIADNLHMSSVADKFASQYMRCVWGLMTALWGDLTNEDNIPGLDDASSYAHQQARKAQVTKWLMSVCRQKIEGELSNSSKGSQSVYLKSLFGLVSSGHIREACQLARKHRDLRLNLLLAQCTRGSTVFREMLKKQLTVWEKIGATEFIMAERLRIYALLAGLVVWETGKLALSSCADVEWQRNVAVHLWYCCNPTTTIADALNRYNDTLNDHRMAVYITQPVPAYQKDGQPTDTELYDICYHLLQLYCNHTYNLNHLINPATFTPYILDYRLIWHLFQCLTALGYRHVSDGVLAHLHTSYAAQLENAGLWHWAVFVVLHMDDDRRRAKMVQDILSRHCSGDITLNNEERFVVGHLHISSEILYEAKALRAMYEGKVEQQVWNLIKAQHWNASHEVIMDKLAPKAIVNGRTNILHKMLSCLVDNNYQIMNWDHQGSIILDFLNVSAAVTELKQPVDRHELEKLATGIAMLCERIPHIPFTTPLEMLCQAEISKKMLNCNKVVTALLENVTGEPSTSQPGLQFLSVMPLAEDEIIAEYRSQANSFVKQLST